ncbi:MAG: 8-oxo-dGTP diphosphatase [Candidatus Sungbacteria bacterium]|nr:8-oxo-dGTP diphosphatase [Candidatus Sungbacteria bacterium]
MADKEKKILTLCVIHQHPMVLLGMKKRGFGAGRWNGFGGKVKDGETIDDAVLRELREEAGVTAGEIERLGLIDFEFRGNPEILEVHIFRGRHIEGEPRESEEMRPQWFHVNEIPFQEMWPDDKHWFPLFLAGNKFRGKCFFDESGNILDIDLSEAKEV